MKRKIPLSIILKIRIKFLFCTDLHLKINKKVPEDHSLFLDKQSSKKVLDWCLNL